METPEDCYFVIRYDEKQQTEVVSAICLNCSENFEEKMFWCGKRGYSPYVWKCSVCEKIIYQPSEEIIKQN